MERSGPVCRFTRPKRATSTKNKRNQWKIDVLLVDEARAVNITRVMMEDK
jgi:hypothetical protein